MKSISSCVFHFIHVHSVEKWLVVVAMLCCTVGSVFSESNPHFIQIKPTSTYPGASGFVLSVTSVSLLFCSYIPFTAESVVQWNGSNRPTTFVDDQHLQAKISATDLAYAGTASVSVYTPGIENSSVATFSIVAAPPMLRAIAPNAAPAGTPGFVLMALGSNTLISGTSGYTRTSVVQWNGSDRPTTFIDPGHLLATIPAGDMIAPGTANVTVFTPGGGTSSSTAFRITDPLTDPGSAVSLAVAAGGATTLRTQAEAVPIQTGYATATNSGAIPIGGAVFVSRQNGVTVSETGVSPSPPTFISRVFVECRTAATIVPGRTDAGVVDINTGIAVANYGPAPTRVWFILRDLQGNILTGGRNTLAAGNHFAKFVNELHDVGPNFIFPPNFQTDIQFGSLEIESELPISVLALRSTVNQRGEFLLTTTPLADMATYSSSDSTYFPQIADGGGYTTTLALLNNSSEIETGTLEFYDESGSPLIVTQAGGTSGASFRYSVPVLGAFRFQSDGSPANIRVGWVRLIPDSLSSMPAASGVFAYNPGSVLVYESGVPAMSSTKHARVYVDLSNNHNTGVALANPGSATIAIRINAFQADGVTTAGTSQETVQLIGNGHTAKFADELIRGLPSDFKGVLDISSDDLFAALALRSLRNERNDFLMTTTPVADLNQPALAPIIFPQIARGGGYETLFIFISPGGTSNLEFRLFNEAGAPLTLGQ